MAGKYSGQVPPECQHKKNDQQPNSDCRRKEVLSLIIINVPCSPNAHQNKSHVHYYVGLDNQSLSVAKGGIQITDIYNNNHDLVP